MNSLETGGTREASRGLSSSSWIKSWTPVHQHNTVKGMGTVRLRNVGLAPLTKVNDGAMWSPRHGHNTSRVLPALVNMLAHYWYICFEKSHLTLPRGHQNRDRI